jgi:hypothetical protein
MKIHGVRLLVVLLLNIAGWATSGVSGPPSLADGIERADSAYRRLPVSLSTYNAAVREICNELETVRLPEFTSSLKKLGVSFDWPKLGFPLRHVEAPTSPAIASATDAGVPVVAGYKTRQAPLYPPEGLFVDATAIYDRAAGHPRFAIRYKAGDVILNGRP